MSQNYTDIPALNESLSFTMGLAYKQFRSLATSALATEFDITLEMLGALRVLSHLGEVPQQAVSDALHRERSVTKRLIDNCIKRELITVKKSEQNKKARYLVITEKGQDIAQKATQCITNINHDFFAPLSDEERDLLTKLNKKLIRHDILVNS
ncbi:MarR family winged helix-turn-helix transcriptional regulator [Photobacterium leiognathi]|uniref:MarR family winged helix-turn-helix transcriptional regulator n=1 Tax=Photobacterium leiognathi TaxID=553611 RepID=UPI0029817D99|nr:MarR family transcriptional regulator [Photobacterium leiognathi]